MLVFARLELEVVHLVEDIAHDVSARQLALDAREDFAYLVLERIGRSFGRLESAKIGEKLVADKRQKIVAGQRLRNIAFAVLLFRNGPRTPAELLRDNRLVVATIEFRRLLARRFEVIKVFEKENPARLLNIVKLAAASGILPKIVVYPLVNLVVHSRPRCGAALLHTVTLRLAQERHIAVRRRK